MSTLEKSICEIFNNVFDPTNSLPILKLEIVVKINDILFEWTDYKIDDRL